MRPITTSFSSRSSPTNSKISPSMRLRTRLGSSSPHVTSIVNRICKGVPLSEGFSVQLPFNSRGKSGPNAPQVRSANTSLPQRLRPDGHRLAVQVDFFAVSELLLRGRWDQSLPLDLGWSASRISTGKNGGMKSRRTTQNHEVFAEHRRAFCPLALKSLGAFILPASASLRLKEETPTRLRSAEQSPSARLDPHPLAINEVWRGHIELKLPSQKNESRQVRGVRTVPEKASRVLGHRLGDGLFNDRIGNAVTAKTLRHNCNRAAFLPSEILPERLADVETDEGLITAEPESRRNLLEIVKNVFWHPNAYRSHRTVL